MVKQLLLILFVSMALLVAVVALEKSKRPVEGGKEESGAKAKMATNKASSDSSEVLASSSVSEGAPTAIVVELPVFLRSELIE